MLNHAMNDETALKLPRVRLDLRKLAASVKVGRESWPLREDEVRLALELRGWSERGGWWTAPGEQQLGYMVYAVTEREG